MKNTISEIKTKLDGIYRRLDTTEENISDLKDIAIKLSKINTPKKKDGEKTRTSVSCEKFQSAQQMCNCGTQRGSERVRERKKFFEEIVSEHFPNMMKTVNLGDPRSS